MLADKEFLERANFGIGEDGFMLGLFADQPGQNRNLVAYRSGNVTLLASDDDPIRQPKGRYRPSHLFDIRSRPGFSGSPVFVYRTSSGNLRFVTAKGSDPLGRWHLTEKLRKDDADDNEIDTFVMLLGIHAGQYHDLVSVRKAEHGEAVEILVGDELQMPNSVAIVVPVWDIIALLKCPRLEERRKAREAKAANY
jgi:hypothetical protein